MADRQPWVGELLTFAYPSPEEPVVIFKIKRAGIREKLKRQDMSSKVRWIQSDEAGEVVTEKDYPMGSMMLSTIMLVLMDWDITDNAKPVPVSEENVIRYLQPEELDALYDEVIRVNPMWGSGGESARKNS